MTAGRAAEQVPKRKLVGGCWHSWPFRRSRISDQAQRDYCQVRGLARRGQAFEGLSCRFWGGGVRIDLLKLAAEGDDVPHESGFRVRVSSLVCENLQTFCVSNQFQAFRGAASV